MSVGKIENLSTNPFMTEGRGSLLTRSSVNVFPRVSSSLDSSSPFSAEHLPKFRYTVLNEKMEQVFAKFFQTKAGRLDATIKKAMLDKFRNLKEGEHLEDVDRFLDSILSSESPGSLRGVIENLIGLMEASGIEKEAVEEFRSDFLELCKVFKENKGSIKRIVANVEVKANFIYRVNRTIRNMVRFAAGFANSASLQGVTTSLGFVCLIGALTNLRAMIQSGWYVVAPNRTSEQRASSMVDFLLHSADFLDDLSVGLNAINSWLHAHPGIAALSIVGLYFAMASVTAGIAKNVFDLYFFHQVKNDLKFAGDNFDYMSFQQEWDERIKNYGGVVGSLVRICEPQFLTIFKDLDDSLEKQGMIFAPGDKREFTDEQNMTIHTAMKGRVKSKTIETSIALVASSMDMVALVALAAAPATGGGAYVAAAGSLMFTTSLMGFTRVWIAGKGVEKMNNTIAEGFGGTAHYKKYHLNSKDMLTGTAA